MGTGFGPIILLLRSIVVKLLPKIEGKRDAKGIFQGILYLGGGTEIGEVYLCRSVLETGPQCHKFSGTFFLTFIEVSGPEHKGLPEPVFRSHGPGDLLEFLPES